eukprot:gene3390-6044_t
MTNPWTGDLYDSVVDFGRADRLLDLCLSSQHLTKSDVENCLDIHKGKKLINERKHPSLAIINASETQLEKLDALHAAKVRAIESKLTQEYMNVSLSRLGEFQERIDKLSGQLSKMVSCQNQIESRLSNEPQIYIDLPCHLHKPFTEIVHEIIEDLRTYNTTMHKFKGALTSQPVQNLKSIHEQLVATHKSSSSELGKLLQALDNITQQSKKSL